MYFKWHEWVTKEVKENLRFWQAENHRHQLPLGRYRPHGWIILLFCWSNLILVERAEDLVLPLPPIGDGRGLASAQLTAPSVSSWGSLEVPTKSPASPSKWFCQISHCSDGTLSAEVTKEHLFTVHPIFLTPTFKTCFSMGRTVEEQDTPRTHSLDKHEQRPRALPTHAVSTRRVL